MRKLRLKEVPDHTTSKWWNKNEFRAQALRHSWGSEMFTKIISDGTGMWMQACLSPKPSCCVTTMLCCPTLSAWAGPFACCPSNHHCQESCSVQISTVCLPCHQPTSHSPHKAFQAASPRCLARMDCSLLFPTPTRPYLCASHNIYQFPLWIIIMHMLFQERWWSELAWCHQWLTQNRHWLNQPVHLSRD